MGSCPSSFQAQFTPNESANYANGTTDIVMKIVDEDGVDKDFDTIVEPIVVKPLEEVNGRDTNVEPINGSAHEAPEESTKVSPLIVEVLDLCSEENSKDHHTSNFDAVRKEPPKLIVRRGAAFTLNLILNRAYNSESDILCLVFTAKHAPSPSYSQGTQIMLPFLRNKELSFTHEEWYIEQVTTDDTSVVVKVVPSSNAIVGEWLLEVDSKIIGDIEAPDFHYKVKEPIVILFNPWCKNDAVFLAEDKFREEYVLSESGLIWRGCHNNLRPCIWNYGQFEKNVLDCCLFILSQLGKLSVVKRADPVKVVRHISAVLNSRNGQGVLVSNWSGHFKGGQSPTTWCGSQVILQKYFKTKKPVKYGQCWVFAGVFTSVCRALGIPSRPVTNFSSAHDTHDSLTVDCFFDCHGRPVEKLNNDSVWNFHVWTEVWMARPDLEPPDLEPKDYGGWQAVDSTPQEDSDGIYQCGPASVAAIKKGEIKKAFDTQLLFSEVNADKVYWRYHGPKQPLKLIKKATEEIGLCISTKAVGKFECEDITHEYKHLECSKDERDVMLRALRQCKNAFSRYYLNGDFEDVKFDFSLSDKILIGEPFTVTLKATNKRIDDKEHNINVCLRVESALYTGGSKKLVKRDDFETLLAAGAEQDMTMKLNYSDYQKLLSDQCAFNVTATAHVAETDFEYCAQDNFRVCMPDITIQVDGEAVQNAPITVSAFFTNPLPKVLKQGIFTLEGPGFGGPITLKCKGDVKVGADARISCKMIPLSSGAKVIAAKFQSKELFDVDGYLEVLVKPSVEVNEKDNNSDL